MAKFSADGSWRSRRLDVSGRGGARGVVSRLAAATLCAGVALFAGSDEARAQASELSETAEDASEALVEILGVGEELGGDATLQADQITYDNERDVVVARGNVEVFYAGRILRADEITYDARNDVITASGRITLINPDGSVIVADSAEFDSQIRDGMIRGVRAVLAEGAARIAAVEGQRIDGRLTIFSRVVYSPCETCAENPVPLWRIRAARVTQDSESRDIIYEDATFDFLGVPIGYLPFFRHADPSVRRRSGFLTPSFFRDSELGAAIRVPYFFELAPNRDITLTPWLFTEENPLLETEYRAWDEWGRYTIGGSFTWSSSDEEEGARGHFIGNGVFGGPAGFTLGFNALYASDDTFLRRYEISNVDRAEINIFAERYGDTGFIDIQASRLQSFREDEAAGTLPLIAPHVTFEQRLAMPYVGGEVGIFGDSVYLRRTNGRDVGRISADLFWERVATSDFGFVFEGIGAVRGDLYAVSDDAEFGEGLEGRVVPIAAATLSYPLGQASETAFHIIEPTAQIVVTPYASNNSQIPNEDSQDTELDHLNIFAVNRFPGRDRLEDGPRATFGFRYQRLPTNGGPMFEFSLGQSVRLRENDSFSEQSGLRGMYSDLVGAWRIVDLPLYSIGHRFRVTDGFNFRRNEVYVQLQPIERIRLDLSYVFVDADPASGSEIDRSEVRFAGELDVTEHWSVHGGFRRDVEQSRWVDASTGLRYEDECFLIDATISRRFNSVEDAPASTNFNLSVSLRTLSDQ